MSGERVHKHERRTVESILVMRGLLTCTRSHCLPVTNHSCHDQCTKGGAESLCPHYFDVASVGAFRPVCQLGQGYTLVPCGLSGVLTNLGGLAARTRRTPIRICSYIRTRCMASTGLLRRRWLGLASSRGIDYWVRCWRGRLSRLILGGGLHAMTQLDLCGVMLLGLSGRRRVQEEGFAVLTSVTFEVGGSFGHLDSFWLPKVPTKMQASRLTVC